MPTTTPSPPKDPNAPYCSNCGYDLSHLTESSKCPECGRPIVEVLTRRAAHLERGRRYRSKARLLGLPVIDIALGPKGGELRGRARGIIAVGDVATGILAIGGVARGFVAIGGMSIGAFSIGGLSVGLVTALGGGALGGVAMGGAAAGVVAQGGGAAGFIAQGGGAVGVYARGGGAWGLHTISMQPPTSDPAAVHVFDSLSWLLGAWPPTPAGMYIQMGLPLVATIAVAAVVALLALFALRNDQEV